MPDADVSIMRDVPTPIPYSVIFKRLMHETDWQQRSMNMWGKKVLQPRLTAWFGDPDRTYVYSGIRNEPVRWTELLSNIKILVESLTSEKFNSVLLNCYRNNDDSMGFHSDDEKELGPEPSIASLTFGDSRTFIFKHKFEKDLPPVRIKLENGSLLLMRGKTQKYWKHAINRESRLCGPRINLTFRKIYSREELMTGSSL